MSHSAIRPTVLNSGLIGSIFCYQIKPTDKATPTASANGGIDVVNQAHTDISNIYILLNAHHNNNLQHIGNFQINGNVQVNGATTDFEVSAMQLHDKLVYLNYLGNSATAEGAGLTIGSSAGNISALTFWSSANQKWQVDASLDVAVFDSDGTLSVWPTGGNDLALPPLSAVQGLSTMENSKVDVINNISGGFSETTSGALQGTIQQSQSIILQNTWVAVTDLSTPRGSAGACGTSNAAIIFGGTDISSNLDSTGVWTGSVWGYVGTLNIARRAHAAAGVRYSALGFGGFSSSAENTTEIFDGSLWTLGNNLNTARYGIAGCGTRNSALSIGGLSGASTKDTVERFNGATWSNAQNLLTANQYPGACGTQQNARVIAGFDGASYISIDEVYNGVMDSWSAGAQINQTRRYFGVAGTANAALIFAGNSGGTYISSTEKLVYNVWKVVGIVTQTRQDLSGVGSSNFALSVAGVSGTTFYGTTEKFYGIVDWEANLESNADGSHIQKNTLRYTVNASPTTLSYTLVAKPMKLVYSDENDLAILGKSNYADGFDDDNTAWPTSVGNIISTRLFDKIL